jgi:hypothetical protein
MRSSAPLQSGLTRRRTAISKTIFVAPVETNEAVGKVKMRQKSGDFERI